MPKIKKKGTSGQAKNYITRTQAVRKLQVSLPDFRRLCIFKGIYPREPRNKRKAAKNSTASTTFYYTKDIQYLLHEPLLAKFREHKALAKKIGRRLGRGEVSDAARLERNLTPKLSLAHIVKDRYPTFSDALRDLEDALCTLFLFANLPQTETVPPNTIQLCQRLCHEFEHYLILTHTLRKSFLSIKGIYYEASIQGQDIRWLVPYKFVQRMAGDVDFRIMGTFVEFYTTLVGFVNFRLYTSIGLVYPPKFDKTSDEKGAELGAFTIEGRSVGGDQSVVAAPEKTQNNGEEMQLSVAAQAEADKVLPQPSSLEHGDTQETPATAPETNGVADSSLGLQTGDFEPTEEPMADETALDTFPAPLSPTADTLVQPSISSTTAANLFSNFTFYLSRETPRHPLELLLRAFGCKRVGWDAVLGEGAYTSEEKDPQITHQVVDRPDLPLPPQPAEVEGGTDARSTVSGRERVPGRTYVQPQWVWDCVNAGTLLRADLYAPGATLPPHLSPWVKPKKGEYDPTKPLAEQEYEGEAEAVPDEDSELEDVMGDNDEGSEEEGIASDRGDSNAKDVETDLLSRDGKEVVSGEGMEVDLAGSSSEDEEDATAGAVEDEFDGFDSEPEAPSEDGTEQHQRELEAEALGKPVQQPLKSAMKPSLSKHAKKRREEEEELVRLKGMMPKRKRKLLEKMTYSNRQKDAEAEKLRLKRRKIEKGARV
ncbi:mRNA-binding ribosome synthesis protein nop7 [Elasticomyces elasticus]|nr:mRNA-binding ribosome synthesis protein nop7 [Elasticomyces elasticus]